MCARKGRGQRGAAPAAHPLVVRPWDGGNTQVYFARFLHKSLWSNSFFAQTVSNGPTASPQPRGEASRRRAVPSAVRVPRRASAPEAPELGFHVSEHQLRPALTETTERGYPARAVSPVYICAQPPAGPSNIVQKVVLLNHIRWTSGCPCGRPNHVQKLIHKSRQCIEERGTKDVQKCPLFEDVSSELPN